MAIKFQYNKTSMQGLNKQLKIRLTALPTLKNKESALRAEVAKQKDEIKKLNLALEQKQVELEKIIQLYAEFDPELVKVKEIEISVKKIAGVKTPVLDKVHYDTIDYSLFLQKAWIPGGIDILKNISQLNIEVLIAKRKMQVLDYARRKTTQKVNLYEKVQIPELNNAVLKIKRYLEDVENLEKSAQKIVKARVTGAAA